MVLHTPTKRKARIEIIPMIDVVFFLLVFFMMASLAMTLSRACR
jgi:biopolymer transport protein ExbD